MAANTVSGPFQPDSPDALARFIAALPGFVPVRALEIIEKWAETAAGAKARALKEDDERALARMIGAEYTLTTMRQFVGMGMSDYALALTADGGLEAGQGTRAEDILALATVHQTVFLQHSGRLASVAEEWGMRSREDVAGGTIHAVDISGIVASPRADRRRGAGAALIRKIADWAASNGKLVTMIKPGSWEAEAYLHGLGFESTDVYGTDLYMVYSGYGFERPPDNPEYHMVALET